MKKTLFSAALVAASLMALTNIHATPVDTDGDGIPDSVETQLGTNPFNADTDGDGLPDGCTNIGTSSEKGELCFHIKNGNFTGLTKSNPYIAYLGETNPLNADTDFDGLKDGDEYRYPDGKFKNPYLNGKYVGLYQKGINLSPLNPDTDGDGIVDGIEAGAAFKQNACPGGFCCGVVSTNIIKAGRLEYFGEAVYTPNSFYGSYTNALLYDTDGDGLPDGNTKTYNGKGAWGEDLNCNGHIDLDANLNYLETDASKKSSYNDGYTDIQRVCQNGICDPYTIMHGPTHGKMK